MDKQKLPPWVIPMICLVALGAVLTGRRFSVTKPVAVAAASPAKPPVKPRLRIRIDAGHGGSDPGASNGNITEKSLTLRAALAMQKAFLKYGIASSLSRNKDGKITYLARTLTTVEEVVLALHFDTAVANPGLWVFYNDNSRADNLGRVVQAALSRFGTPVRFEHHTWKLWKDGSRGLYIRQTKKPALLLELGNVRAYTDLEIEQRVTVVAAAVANWLKEQDA
jgi:N-acetylmuramoyl-L-alanine amidase